jgi:hypothetical protein
MKKSIHERILTRKTWSPVQKATLICKAQNLHFCPEQNYFSFLKINSEFQVYRTSICRLILPVAFSVFEHEDGVSFPRESHVFSYVNEHTYTHSHKHTDTYMQHTEPRIPGRTRETLPINGYAMLGGVTTHGLLIFKLYIILFF